MREMLLRDCLTLFFFFFFFSWDLKLYIICCLENPQQTEWGMPLNHCIQNSLVRLFKENGLLVGNNMSPVDMEDLAPSSCSAMSEWMCKLLPIPPLSSLKDLKHLFGIFLCVGRPVSGICADTVLPQLLSKPIDYRLLQFQHVGILSHSADMHKCPT